MDDYLVYEWIYDFVEERPLLVVYFGILRWSFL